MTARRPRNLRKGEPAAFRAAWPIEDEDMTMPALIAEATPLLADLLTEAGAVITGEATWHIQDAWGSRGSAARRRQRDGTHALTSCAPHHC